MLFIKYSLSPEVSTVKLLTSKLGPQFYHAFYKLPHTRIKENIVKILLTINE